MVNISKHGRVPESELFELMSHVHLIGYDHFHVATGAWFVGTEARDHLASRSDLWCQGHTFLYRYWRLGEQE